MLASVISTISSQLYKNVIDESSKRIKGKRDDDDDDGDTEEQAKEEKAKEGKRTERRSASSPIYLEQDELPAQFSPHLPPRIASAPARRARPAGRSVSSSSTVVPASPVPVKSFRKERKKTKKKVIAVSVISSFLTLVVVCGIILFVTGGKGTDVFIRDAVNKSNSIKEDAQKLTNQAEGKSAPSSGSSSLSSSSPSQTVSPPPSSAQPKTEGAPSPSSSPPSPSSPQSGEKKEENPPSTKAPSTSDSSSQQGSESGNNKEKKDSSAPASAPDALVSNGADQNAKKN
ncbi:MAG: hypothetical protein II014_02150 [Bifidobacteriaceae bacterium]|nr:hypothetical protein [Bifidobacteriaceae bacterium]